MKKTGVPGSGEAGPLGAVHPLVNEGAGTCCLGSHAGQFYSSVKRHILGLMREKMGEWSSLAPHQPIPFPKPQAQGARVFSVNRHGRVSSQKSGSGIHDSTKDKAT